MTVTTLLPHLNVSVPDTTVPAPAGPINPQAGSTFYIRSVCTRAVNCHICPQLARVAAQLMAPGLPPPGTRRHPSQPQAPATAGDQWGRASPVHNATARRHAAALHDTACRPGQMNPKPAVGHPHSRHGLRARQPGRGHPPACRAMHISASRLQLGQPPSPKPSPRHSCMPANSSLPF